VYKYWTHKDWNVCSTGDVCTWTGLARTGRYVLPVMYVLYKDWITRPTQAFMQNDNDIDYWYTYHDRQLTYNLFLPASCVRNGQVQLQKVRKGIV